MANLPPDADYAPQRFARALLTMPLGLDAFDRLLEQFPSLGRENVYYGAILAVADLAAGLVAAEAEVSVLRRRLAATEQRRAA